jgi:hypothetical protein
VKKGSRKKMSDPIVIGDNDTPSVALNAGAGPSGTNTANVEVQGGGYIHLYAADGTDGNYVGIGGGTGIVLNAFVGVAIPQLPTSDPHSAGYLWNDNGTVKVSAG